MPPKNAAKLKLRSIKLALGIVSLAIALLLGIVTAPVIAQNTNSATSVDPESVTAAQKLSQQGKLKVEQQNYRGAIADFSRAILLNPNEADLYYQRGLVLRELSDLEAAIQDFDDAILRNPNHAWAYLQRAGIFFNVESNQGFTSFQGFRFRQTTSNRGDARGILDLRIARDLFAKQGDQEGFQTADQLIEHFGGNIEGSENQNF
ncbi:MAG: tetratricopeptide repeat protein [Cyanobacteria bacterium P01_G01_bin.39]